MTALGDLVSTGVVRQRVPLGPMTTYKVGGNAEYLATVESELVLEEVVAAAEAEALDLLVIGRGSNMLVSSAGFNGLAVRLVGDFLDFSIGEGVVIAGAGVPLPVLARAATKAGQRGLEFFVGVPGSVGGAVRMNAGCYGTETSEVLGHARVLCRESGVIREQSSADLELAYRHSNLVFGDVVLSAEFLTSSGPVADGEELMREVTKRRRDGQPGGTYNAGSVFKNPEGDRAGRLIDSLEMKGLRVGGASVSHRHANFIEAGQGATPEDIHELIVKVRTRVLAETSIDLEPEVILVGFGDEL